MSLGSASIAPYFTWFRFDRDLDASGGHFLFSFWLSNHGRTF